MYKKGARKSSLLLGKLKKRGRAEEELIEHRRLADVLLERLLREELELLLDLAAVTEPARLRHRLRLQVAEGAERGGRVAPGVVQLLSAEGSLADTLSPGGYFGEASHSV